MIVAGPYDKLFNALSDRAVNHGIRVLELPLSPESPVIFDGPTITLHPICETDARCYYLAHAVGSIAQWSAERAKSQATYDELRAAKANRATNSDRFERALTAYLAFEERSSEHAVWLLADLKHSWAVPAYTVFFRADLAAMEQFHREGVAPVWQEFYPTFEAGVRGGAEVRPFKASPLPFFRPVRIELQEVMREEDGQP